MAGIDIVGLLIGSGSVGTIMAMFRYADDLGDGNIDKPKEGSNHG